MKKNLEFSVDSRGTLLPFLLSRLDGQSRNNVKGLLTRGQITVDGQVRTHHAFALSPGQKVRVLSEAAASPARHNPRLAILYEDENLLAIDKPAGLLAIATDGERENTAYHMANDYVRAHNRAGRVFIVHRLDRETSGVMLLAKSERIKHALQEHWEQTALLRGYSAVVEGEVRTPGASVTSWLKQTKTLLVYSSSRQDDGKLAVTHYKTIQAAERYSLLDISLETGRKNQIRVHMKDIGHPVAGDKKYGAVTDPFGRLGLHASVLTIKHPSTGRALRLEAAAPGVFGKVF